MDKGKVIEFFNSCAKNWDAEMIRNQSAIDYILDAGGIKEGVRVLDVACGTGVLFPDYIARGAIVTGVDISPEMVKLAREKHPDIEVVCADVEEKEFREKFDAVMVYNALPHFDSPQRLVEVLSKALESGGRLTIAHGMSRAAIENCHRGSAKQVSRGLIDEESLADIFSEYFSVDVKVSDYEKYVVSGTRI